MPNDVVCPICEQLTTLEQLDVAQMCSECAKTLEDHDVQAGDESDVELRKFIDSYMKKRAYRQAYNARPDVKAKRKAYNEGRRAWEKSMLRKAKELGLL